MSKSPTRTPEQRERDRLRAKAQYAKNKEHMAATTKALAKKVREEVKVRLELALPPTPIKTKANIRKKQLTKEEERELAIQRQVARESFWKSQDGKSIRREINSDFYANDPEYREKAKASNKRYALAHPEKVAEMCSRYMKTEKGKASAARGQHKRRSAVENTPCTLTAEEWRAIKEMQGNRCKHCGREFTKSNPATKDHVLPVSLGGGLVFENVQALCKSCNSRKQNRREEELEYLKIKGVTKSSIPLNPFW